MARKKSIRTKRGRKSIKKRGRKAVKRSSKSQFSIALKRLKKLKKHERYQAMSMANDSFIRQFCSQVRKLKHAKLSPKSRKALQKHKKKLQKLVRKRATVKQQRAMLTQRGGKVNVLDLLLSTIPFVAAIL